MKNNFTQNFGRKVYDLILRNLKLHISLGVPDKIEIQRYFDFVLTFIE